jgi:hypothetical protein
MLLLTETSIHSLHEHIGRPVICRIPSIKIQRRVPCLHLLHGHTPLDHALNAVANDRDDVPVAGNIFDAVDVFDTEDTKGVTIVVASFVFLRSIGHPSDG